jgi:hypothetical protein
VNGAAGRILSFAALNMTPTEAAEASVRDLHDIQITRGVTHILAPRDPEQLLQLSEAELPLEGGVADILAAHVEGGLQDVKAKAAKFVDRRDDHACGAFGRLLGGRPRLLENSQELARMLYEIAENDERVSDGTLAVLLCRALDESGSAVRFPAILKLDPSDTLHTVTDTEPATRKRRVRYEVDHNALPSKNEKIQKCVFVQSVDDSAAYEMLVVDRQRRSEKVSTFWVRDFLGAEMVLDAAERTRTLYRSLRSARNEVEQDLDALQLRALDQVIEGAVVQATVNVDALVAGLPVPEEVRTRIDARVSRALPDREFDLDPEVARQFIRRRTFRADNGLRVSIEAAHADMLHVEDVERGDEETRLRRVWFETRSWKES